MELIDGSVTFFNGDVADQLYRMDTMFTSENTGGGNAHAGIGVPDVAKYYGAFGNKLSLLDYEKAFAPYTVFNQIKRILKFIVPVLHKMSLKSFLEKAGFRGGERLPFDALPSTFKNLLRSRLYIIIRVWISTTQNPIDFQIDPSKADGIFQLYSAMFNAFSEPEPTDILARQSKIKTEVVKTDNSLLKAVK